MSNRETKISALAHSLLQEHPKSSDKAMPWRTKKVDYASVLDTFIKEAKETRVMIANNRPANRYECVEVDALIFYTARENMIDEAELRKTICEKMGFTSFAELTLADYTKIRNYLWSLSGDNE